MAAGPGGGGALVRADTAYMRAVGDALKQVDPVVKKAFHAEISRLAKKVPPRIKAEALQSLPKGGGLNVWASRINIRVRQAYSGRNPGITVTAAKDNKRSVRRSGSRGRPSTRTFGKADLQALDRGRVMHPVWGRGPLVGPQMVRPGFWTRTVQGPVAVEAAAGMQRAMQQILDYAARAGQNGRRVA